MERYKINLIIDRLNVSSKELDNFTRYKNKYSITDKLFIDKENKSYKLIIELKENNINNLFNNDIEENDLRYTLKCTNKIIYKNKTKNQMINLITKMLESKKGVK